MTSLLTGHMTEGYAGWLAYQSHDRNKICWMASKSGYIRVAPKYVAQTMTFQSWKYCNIEKQNNIIIETWNEQRNAQVLCVWRLIALRDCSENITGG